ncbi:hypothetical protein HPB48_013651 [Haemaphysalis longicornis]|uniref:THAP-type domain-containing protein n=1 Tax=Haemaphysalis longicornis TaxID=44386 RepID=A0A9J6FX17_HAELO|nr:hypothetical protein HPB48_013651 [Haemaphysalis longicornis]
MEPGSGMFRLPRVITNQCQRTKRLSGKRQHVWLARINRKDLKNLDHIRVCGRHFITDKPSGLTDDQNHDWEPTRHLGYKRGELPATALSARFQRSKKRGRATSSTGVARSTTSQPAGTGPAQPNYSVQSGPLFSNFDIESSAAPSISVDRFKGLCYHFRLIMADFLRVQFFASP